MTIDLDGLQLASHEAAHCAAALSVGRRIFSVTRAEHGPKAHGATHSESRDGETIEDALVVLLTAVVVQPVGGQGAVQGLPLRRPTTGQRLRRVPGHGPVERVGQARDDAARGRA